MSGVFVSDGHGLLTVRCTSQAPIGEEKDQNGICETCPWHHDERRARMPLYCDMPGNQPIPERRDVEEPTEPTCPAAKEYTLTIAPAFEKWIQHLAGCWACKQWMMSNLPAFRASLDVPAEVIERALDELADSEGQSP